MLVATDGDQRTALVVFDLGGTTIHDDGTINRIFVEVAREYKLEADLEEVQSFQGRTKKELFHVLGTRRHETWPEAADSLAEEANEEFERRLLVEFAEKPIEVVDGTAETMQYLRDQDIQVAITTGFWRAILDVILESTGLGELLDSSVATDEVAKPKPAPYMIFRAMEECEIISVRQVVSVGDTPLDCVAGCNAGAGSVIGVLSGTHARSQLERVPHNFILDSSARVRELFETGRIR
ncbi:MAG: HAD hydrolase-like protein [Armatimonadia bacterium]|nr:HAD hydrolase-like protein [Armatimonadia bacterium]